MTAQVVTPENHVEFIQTGKVAEFKAPDAKAEPEVKPADATAAQPAKEAEVKPSEDKPRDEQGKFKKEEAKADSGDDDDVAAQTEKVRKIINKKHRQMMEAQEFATGEGRRALQAEKRAAELEREIAALRSGKSDGPAPEGKSGDPDEPQPGDFKTVGEYTRALTKYEVRKAAEGARANAREHQQQSEASERIAAHVKREDEFRTAAPDYDEVVGGADIEFHPAGLQYLVESDFGPQIAYHLAKNPEEVTRLNRLSPSKVLAELGKMETRFESKAAPVVAAAKAPEVSKAPAPISVLEAKSATVAKKPEEMTFQELREFRRNQEIAKRASGR